MQSNHRHFDRPARRSGRATAINAAGFLTLAVGTAGSTLAADEGTLAEVVVTAQKRTESLQDVPMSVSAFSGERLVQDGIASLQDLNSRAPGLSFSSYSAGQPEIAIRGIGTKEDGAAASGSTVVSIDDVYIAARTAQVFDIFDLERVEILRGPQGTLYGKNSIAGSINFITTRPTAQTRARLSQSVGNYGRNDTSGLLSGGIARDLSAKISFSHRSHSGYLRNRLPSSAAFNTDQGESDNWAWRTQLRWQPTDWDVLLSLDGARDEMGASNREPVGSSGPLHNCACASNPLAVNTALSGSGNPHDTFADEAGFTDRTVHGVSLRVDRTWDSVTGTSISAYRKSDFDWYEDASGLPASGTFVDLSGASGNPGALLAGLPPSAGFTFDASNRAKEITHQYTQELRLTSADDDGVDWVTGLFWSKEEVERQEGFRFPALGRADRLPSDMLSVQQADVASAAAYGQLKYPLTQSLRVTAGLRYSHEKKESVMEGRVLSGLPLLLQNFPATAAQKSWTNASGKLVIDWTAAEDLLIYVSAATGFKSGGFTGSASTALQAATPYDPEEAINYEVGLKTQLFSQRLLLNTSVFHTDYRDLQVTRFFQPVGRTFGEFITENAGSAKSEGLELELTALPLHGLEVGVSYAYLDARFTRFTGLASTIGTGSFTGNRLRQAPQHSANAHAQYSLDLGDLGQLSAKLDYRYQGLSYYDPDNNPNTSIPAFDLWNARLAWSSHDDRWEVAGWVRNLTDEAYRTHVYSQRDSRIAFATFGAPRTYGVTVAFSY